MKNHITSRQSENPNSQTLIVVASGSKTLESIGIKVNFDTPEYFGSHAIPRIADTLVCRIIDGVQKTRGGGGLDRQKILGQ